jgi:hypothetical protein
VLGVFVGHRPEVPKALAVWDMIASKCLYEPAVISTIKPAFELGIVENPTHHFGIRRFDPEKLHGKVKKNKRL